MTASDIPTNEANKQKIADLFSTADYLSAWETSFLRSIEGQLNRGSILSSKQQAVLDKMVAKAAERFD